MKAMEGLGFHMKMRRVILLLAFLVAGVNAGRLLHEADIPIDTGAAVAPMPSAVEDAEKEKSFTFYMHHPLSQGIVNSNNVNGLGLGIANGGSNNVNGLGLGFANGGSNNVNGLGLGIANGGIGPQPLTFPAASLPINNNKNNNLGLTLGGGGLVVNGGVGVVGGGGVISANGLPGGINGNGNLGGINNAGTVGFGINAVDGATGEKAMRIEDEELTEGAEEGSTVIGKAEGYFLSLSHNPHLLHMAFTATFSHLDSDLGLGLHSEELPALQIAGELQTGGEGEGEGEGEESEMSVMGGSGAFEGAKGKAVVKCIPSPDHQHLLLKFHLAFSV